MSLRTYNGFSAYRRRRAGQIQAAAVVAGQIKPASVSRCVVCANAQAAVLHVEDYAAPLECIEPMCERCHTWWHKRISNPTAALRYFESVIPTQTLAAWRLAPMWYGPEGLSPWLERLGPLNRPDQNQA